MPSEARRVPNPCLALRIVSTEEGLRHCGNGPLECLFVDWRLTWPFGSLQPFLCGVVLVEGVHLLVGRYWHRLPLDVWYQFCTAYVDVLRGKVGELLAFVQPVPSRVLLLLVGPRRLQVLQVEHLTFSLGLLLVRHQGTHPFELTLLRLPLRDA